MKPILFNTDMVQAILNGRKTETRRPIKPQPRVIGAGPTMCGGFKFLDIPGKGPIWDHKPYQPGDILYVRETWGNWCYDDPESNATYYQYRADYPNGAKTYMYDDEHECDLPKWHPSIHMPKEAARLFLKVTQVRAERVQDITEEGAMAEGIRRLHDNLSDEEFTHWAKNLKLHSGIDVGEKDNQSWLNYLWHGNDGLTKKQIESWPYQFSGYKSARDSFSSLWQLVYGNWDKNPWVWVICFERIEKEDLICS